MTPARPTVEVTGAAGMVRRDADMTQTGAARR